MSNEDIITDILAEEGQKIVDGIQQNMESTQTDASGKTSSSLRWETEVEGRKASLSIYGRAFIWAVETGRGPRKSSAESDFKENLIDWMRIRGVGAGMPEKKFQQLARFLQWRNNKLGSVLFRKGGRKDIITPEISDDRVSKIADRVTKAYADLVFTNLTP